MRTLRCHPERSEGSALMRRESKSLAALRTTLMVCLAAANAFAQESAPASIATTIQVRKLGPVVRTSSITFGGVQHVRRLSDGRLLVNDPSRRQVIMLDTALANPVVVIDSV